MELVSLNLILVSFHIVKDERVIDTINTLFPAENKTYLICGIAVPNNEFAILRGTY